MSDDPPEQVSLTGTPIAAEPADDVFDDEPKCANHDDGPCRRLAVIGVKLQTDGFDRRDGYVPVCPRHAKAAWLYAAGVADEYGE